MTMKGVFYKGEFILFKDIKTRFPHHYELMTTEEDYQRVSGADTSVTKLVAHTAKCRGMVYFAEKIDYYSAPESIWGLTKGKLLHESMLPWSSLKEQYIKVRLPNQRTVSGKPDGYNDLKARVIDVKNCVFPPKDPRPHDVQQLRILKVLLDHQLGMNVQEGELRYLGAITPKIIKFKFSRTPAAGEVKAMTMQELVSDVDDYFLCAATKTIDIIGEDPCNYCSYCRWCDMGLSLLMKLPPYKLSQCVLPVATKQCLPKSWHEIFSEFKKNGKPEDVPEKELVEPAPATP